MLKNLRDVKKYYDIGKNVLYPINRSITGNGTKKTLKQTFMYFQVLEPT